MESRARAASRKAATESTRLKRVAPFVLGAIMLLAFIMGRGAPASAQTVVTVSSTADPSASGLCTLRDAINVVQGGSPSGGDSCPTSGSGAYLIQFSVTGTIGLSSKMPTITTTSGLTITGPAGGITIDGGNTYQAMYVNSGAVISISGLTIQNCTSVIPTDPTGIPGGAIVNSGTLTLTNFTFNDNDTGNNGGAIINEGGTLTLYNSTLFGNFASGAGGGVYNSSGTLTVNNSSFNNNEAGTTDGGGIDNASGTVTVTNSTFSGDSASSSGGAIANYDTLTVINSTFAGNQAGSGAIYNAGSSTANVSYSTFYQNIAFSNASGIVNGGTLVSRARFWPSPRTAPTATALALPTMGAITCPMTALVTLPPPAARTTPAT